MKSYDDAAEETNEMIRVTKEMEAKSFMAWGEQRRLTAKEALCRGRNIQCGSGSVGARIN